MRSNLLDQSERNVKIYFDNSLPKMAEIVIRELGLEVLAGGTALRDTSGRLCFYASIELGDEQRVLLTAALTQELGEYARKDRVIAGVGEFGVKDALNSSDARVVELDSTSVRLIDRRLVGADWLRAPVARTAGAPRFVFASLKGGVGRSTALSVVAAHAAARGRRVLVVDLDLEAPGLGAMLLDRETTPQFGIIDALVERALAPLDPAFLADLVSASTLTNRGRIDVVPAFGARSLANPADILAKIGRAYGEVIHEDGSIETMLDQISAIIQAVEESNRYDLVLVDARAGLHETAAAALLGLGAEILCFGIDEPQTFHGYRALFSHMNRYAKSKAAENDWFARISLVQAKAPLDAALRSDFARRCQQMLSESDRASDGNGRNEVPLPDGFSDVAWDETVSDAELGLTDITAAVEVLAVTYDNTFANFAPLRVRDQISEAAYMLTYGALLKYIDQGLIRAEVIPR